MKKNRIFLSPPHMGGNEKELLIEAFDSNWIAPIGPHVERFELEISKYLKVKSAAALSSGTAALHLALRLLKLKEGDRILCPSFTFVASANVILYEKCEPIFIDSNPENWTICIDSCEKAIKKYKPKAIIAVDIYGHSCNYDQLIPLCKKYNINLIEDSAEALGSVYNNKKCGTFGDIGIYSFNGNKIITTSGGGMLVSDNEDYVREARFLSSQARSNKLHYEHEKIGYNYRLSNLLSAVGSAQLSKIDYYVNKRVMIFKKYKESLGNFPGVKFIKKIPSSYPNYWLTVLTIEPNACKISSSEIIKLLEKENIESRPLWKPMHRQPLFKNFKYIKKYNNEDVSYKLFQKGICLPSGSNLNEKDQGRIIDILVSSLKN